MRWLAIGLIVWLGVAVLMINSERRKEPSKRYPLGVTLLVYGLWPLFIFVGLWHWVAARWEGKP